MPGGLISLSMHTNKANEVLADLVDLIVEFHELFLLQQRPCILLACTSWKCYQKFRWDHYWCLLLNFSNTSVSTAIDVPDVCRIWNSYNPAFQSQKKKKRLWRRHSGLKKSERNFINKVKKDDFGIPSAKPPSLKKKRSFQIVLYSYTQNRSINSVNFLLYPRSTTVATIIHTCICASERFRQKLLSEICKLCVLGKIVELLILCVTSNIGLDSDSHQMWPTSSGRSCEEDTF